MIISLPLCCIANDFMFNPLSTAQSDYIAVTAVSTYQGHRLLFKRDKIDPRSKDILNVTIIDDDIGEPTETFEIYLVEVRKNAYVSKPVGTVTILDDDTRMKLHVYHLHAIIIIITLMHELVLFCLSLTVKPGILLYFCSIFVKK